MAYCTSCGAPLSGDEKFCAQCGAAISPISGPSLVASSAHHPAGSSPVIASSIRLSTTAHKCVDCGGPVAVGKHHCDACEKKRMNPRGGIRHKATNRVVLATILGVLFVGAVGIFAFAWIGNRNSLPSLDSSGWSGTYDCYSTAGNTKGMSYAMSLNLDGSVTLSGLHSGVWYESEQYGESPKSDITVQGLADYDGKSVLVNLHKVIRNGSTMLTGHGIDLNCVRR